MHYARTMCNGLYISATIKDCSPKMYTMYPKKYYYNKCIDLFYILSVANK